MTDCIICGGPLDVERQTWCSLCATMTWGPAVVAGFIQQLQDCHDRLAEAEARLRMLDQRGR